jgi:hypothetical protein
MSFFMTSAGYSAADDTARGVHEAVAIAKNGLSGNTPRLCILAATMDHDAGRVYEAVRAELPGVPIHGATTSLGVLGRDGVVMGSNGSIGVLLFSSSDDAAFSTGSADLSEGAKAAGQKAAAAIMANGPKGQTPRLIFIAATPGNEEQVLEGIHSVLPNVPVFGGSAADHAIQGGWSIFTNGGTQREGVTLAAIYGDNIRVGAAIEGPYEPTANHAQVTAANGRTVKALDNRPATEVLHSWLGEAVADQVREGGNLLMQTALNPIGIARGGSDGKPFHVLLHPAHAHAEGSIDLFAEAPEGSTVCLMSGTGDSLVGIVDRLVDRCLETSTLAVDETRGAFLIYCAGCAGALGNRINEVLARLSGRLPNVPLLGFCTFGEQGHVPAIGNVHTNLSVALVVVG